MVHFPVGLSCFCESLERCEGGQDSGCSSQQEIDCCFSFCNHLEVERYLKPHSFLAAMKALSATFKDTDRLWKLNRLPFFILLVFFFPLPSHMRVTSERFLPLKFSACPWEGDILHWGLLFSAVELQSGKKLPNGGRLVLKWKGLILNSCWLCTAVRQLTWMECFFLIHNDVSEKRNLTDSNLTPGFGKSLHLLLMSGGPFHYALKYPGDGCQYKTLDRQTFM